MRKLTPFVLLALALSACADIYYKAITYTVDTDFYYPGRLYHPQELRSIRVSWHVVGGPSIPPQCETYLLGSPVGGVDLARRVDVTEPDSFVALATSVDFEVVGCTTSDCSCGPRGGEIPRDPPGAVVRQRSIARLSPQGGLRRIFLSRDCYGVVCAPEDGVERTCVAGGRCVPIDQVGVDVTSDGDAGAPPRNDAGARALADAAQPEAGSAPPPLDASTEIIGEVQDFPRTNVGPGPGAPQTGEAPARFPENGGFDGIGSVDGVHRESPHRPPTEPSTNYFERPARDDPQPLGDASTLRVLDS